MSTYVIGDVHGQLATLRALIERIHYGPGDELWFVGDLVNNGQESAEVLRWVRAQGERATVVLGNHDLHMLAVAAGAKRMRKKDTFQDVLSAPDADELCTWLRHQKMAHARDGWLMIHAGVLPEWDVTTTLIEARAIESQLRDDAYPQFFDAMYGNEPRRMEDVSSEEDRLRLGVNALTRMRVLDADGALEFRFKSTLDDVPDDLTPWFRCPKRATRGEATLLFGHWSAIGYLSEDGVHALDSGATWGYQLTALCLEDGEITQVDAV
ncbi:MAG: symmetrical bis(5'-nucleosyl)-tetraphosphatase [Myxococcota bacterium]